MIPFDLIKLIFNENKSVIRSYKSNIDDCENNINYYEEKLSRKEENIKKFNSEIKNIIKIFSFKKTSLKIDFDIFGSRFRIFDFSRRFWAGF